MIDVLPTSVIQPGRISTEALLDEWLFDVRMEEGTSVHVWSLLDGLGCRHQAAACVRVPDLLQMCAVVSPVCLPRRNTAVTAVSV